MIPSVGRAVHYTLTEDDATRINKRRKMLKPLRSGSKSPVPLCITGTRPRLVTCTRW
jgi:hypothetical protein